MANEAVLIVDDDAAIRKLLTKVVEGNGYQAFTASNGKEAVSLAQSRKFDLILLDIMMNVPMILIPCTAWTSERTIILRNLLIRSCWEPKLKL